MSKSKMSWINFRITYEIIFIILLITAILDRAGLFGAKLQLHTLYSFTTISNAFLFLITSATLVTYVFLSKNIGVTLSLLRTIGVMMILLTGFVYHFILLPQKIVENPNYNVFTYGNIVAHYIAPIAMFLDWLMFDEKGKISKWFPVVFSSIPIFYFIITSVYGYYGSTIPNKESSYVYFFMDFDNLGFIGVMKWVLLILVIITLLSYSVYFLDNTLAKKEKKRV